MSNGNEDGKGSSVPEQLLGLEDVNDPRYQEKMLDFEIECNGGKGNPNACHHVGEYFSVIRDEHARAAKIYENNCTSNGYGASCFKLAKLYLSGKGVDNDDTKAGQYFKQACDKDHLPACYHAGILKYLTATSDEKNDKLNEADRRKLVKDSMRILQDTCEKGDVESCYVSASQLIKPHALSDLKKDAPKALTYLHKGCDMNHPPSCYNLAVMYNKGAEGVPADQEKFKEYKEKTKSMYSLFGGLKGHKSA